MKIWSKWDLIFFDGTLKILVAPDSKKIEIWSSGVLQSLKRINIQSTPDFQFWLWKRTIWSTSNLNPFNGIFNILITPDLKENKYLEYSKIVSFGCTEGRCTRKWCRISQGLYWYNQKQCSYFVWCEATLRNVIHKIGDKCRMRLVLTKTDWRTGRVLDASSQSIEIKSWVLQICNFAIDI